MKISLQIVIKLHFSFSFRGGISCHRFIVLCLIPKKSNNNGKIWVKLNPYLRNSYVLMPCYDRTRPSPSICDDVRISVEYQS